MPPRTRSVTRRADANRPLDHWESWFLTWGRSCGLGDDITHEQAAELWEIHKDEFLAQYIKGHPGRRPWCWWRFEHKQERPITHPAPPPAARLDAERRDQGGLLWHEIWMGPPPYWQPLLEDECDYLDRLGLLQPSERERYERTSFAKMKEKT